MRSREEWERWYVSPNPWRVDGSELEYVQHAIVVDRLRHARFVNVLDLGCGEGRLTNSLSKLARNTYGVDIAGNAIERARDQFPHIHFEQAELLEFIERSHIARLPFDFVSLSEVLYYFQRDEERSAVVKALAQVGTPTCLYYVSAIVTGASKYRRYFTHEELVGLLSERFHVVDAFPSVVDVPRSLRLLRLLLPRSRRLSLTKTWTISRNLGSARQVGYFAVKRAGSCHDVPAPAPRGA